MEIFCIKTNVLCANDFKQFSWPIPSIVLMPEGKKVTFASFFIMYIILWQKGEVIFAFMKMDLHPEGNRWQKGNASFVKGKSEFLMETANERRWSSSLATNQRDFLKIILKSHWCLFIVRCGGFPEDIFHTGFSCALTVFTHPRTILPPFASSY